MKAILACCLLLTLCSHCIGSCENNWTESRQHSVNSSGVFSVSVNLTTIPNLDNETSLTWTFTNCETVQRFLCTVVYRDTAKEFTTQCCENSAKFYADELFLHSSLTIYDLLAKYDNICVSLLVGTCRDIQQILTVKYCDDLSKTSEKLKVTSSNSSSWNDNSTYTCLDEDCKIIVDNNFSHPYDNYQRNCLDNATWSGSATVICACAPNSTIKEKNATVDNKFYAGQNVTLLCDIEGGYPAANETRYNVQQVGAVASTSEVLQVNQVFTRMLSPELNKAHFTCQGLNQFTRITNTTAGISQPFIPNVLFAPMTDERYKLIEGALGKTTTLSYTFTTNPLVQKENLTLTFTGNGTKKDKLDQIQGNLSGSYNQTYEYIVTVQSIENYGLYLLNVTSSITTFETLQMERNLTGEDRDITTTISNQITSSPGTSGPRNELTVPIYAIVAPVIGVLVIAIIILIVCMVRKRQHKRDTSIVEQRANPIYEESSANAPVDKEEKINPLYGTSPGANAEKEERLNPLYGSANQDKATSDTANKKKKAAKSEKVEKKNPLYATSEGSNIVEDAYAEIEKSKNKGNANPVFTVETTGDTYAEVKKPKKDKPDASQAEVTYAEVQKSKRTKKDASLHGISND